MKRAVLIAGPTASGKSAVALALAERLGGVVINADSMQVYADLAILTARPSAEQTTRAPHRMFGHVDAAEAYSVGRWLDDVRHELAAAARAGRVPVLVGGTGLYFKALTQGLSAIPKVSDAVRERVRSRATGVGTADLHAMLARLDPIAAARLRPTDPQRILRALEVMEETGRSIVEFQTERQRALLPLDEAVGVVLVPDRSDLVDSIDRRFDAMLEAGAIEEVERLANRKLDPTLPALRALGVPPLMAFLRGEISREQAVSSGKTLTRAYARRQVTFARHQLADWVRVTPSDAFATVSARWAALP